MDDSDLDYMAEAAAMADFARRFRADADRPGKSRRVRRFASERAREAEACSELLARCADAEGAELVALKEAARRRHTTFRNHLRRALERGM